MASQLTFYQAMTGDWRNLFKQLDKINAVSSVDIQRVANSVFVNSNRTIGTIEPVK
jgi:predicted Zn-dependent peptidase